MITTKRFNILCLIFLYEDDNGSEGTKDEEGDDEGKDEEDDDAGDA